MENLDFSIKNLPAFAVFNSYGVHVGIRTNEPDIFSYLPSYFPPGAEDEPDSPADVWYSIVAKPPPSGKKILYQLYQNERKLREGFILKRILNLLDSKIRLWIGRTSKDKLFVHAGAVAWNNLAIIIPGRSGVGKTNLVAELIKAGACYYSDEYAVLDDCGYMHPYARPLSFRQGFGNRIRLCSVSDLGGRHGSAPLRVGLVVHTRYRDKSEWAPHRISPGEAMLALMGNSLAVRERPAFALSILSRVVSGAKLLEGDRGEAKDAASAIIEYADQIEIKG